MKKPIIMLVLAAAMTAYMPSCTGDGELRAPIGEEPAVTQSTNETSAIRDALQAAVNLIEEGNATRSGEGMDLSSVTLEPLLNGRTRSAANLEGNIYAANFTDGEGFAIISTIPNLPQV